MKYLETSGTAGFCLTVLRFRGFFAFVMKPRAVLGFLAGRVLLLSDCLRFLPDFAAVPGFSSLNTTVEGSTLPCSIWDLCSRIMSIRLFTFVAFFFADCVFAAFAVSAVNLSIRSFRALTEA